ncbi:MAG TPA: NAD(P)-binding domain-containing protein [Candidatus Dormibacteraeota bacterium]
MADFGVLPWALVAEAGDVDVNGRTRMEAALHELADFDRIWALLATCHRVELYGFGPAPSRTDMRLLEGEPAVRHLFRVAAGLESAVVGETEILGQVRDALGHSRERGTDERVARLFETAIAVGRTARAMPLPARDGLAERAVGWLDRRASLAGRPVLVVGTGAMGTSLAAAAASAGGVVTVAGRRPERAAMDLRAAAHRAPEMAAVAVALRGEWVELAAAAETSPDRRLPPLADLSAPPAVPARVRLALGPDFLGIDELWQRSSGQSAWVERAVGTVEEAVAEYMGWLQGRGSVRTLVALRERGESRRRARVERLLRRLPQLDERSRGLIDAMSRQLVTDLLHEPVTALRADPDGSQGEAARRLFNL